MKINFNVEQERPACEHTPKCGYWVAKNQKVRVCEMSDQHILNVLNLAYAYNSSHHVRAEAFRRGLTGSEQQQTLSTDVIYAYKAMLLRQDGYLASPTSPAKWESSRLSATCGDDRLVALKHYYSTLEYLRAHGGFTGCGIYSFAKPEYALRYANISRGLNQRDAHNCIVEVQLWNTVIDVDFIDPRVDGTLPGYQSLDATITRIFVHSSAQFGTVQKLANRFDVPIEAVDQWKTLVKNLEVEG